MTDRRLLLLKRKRAILRARENLIDFTRLMMPQPDHADDPDYSLYDPQKFHRVIGAGLEEIEAHKYRRLMIDIGPRFGKTTLASKMYPAFYAGRHPERSIIVATYNEHYAEDLGRGIRDVMMMPAYAQVFPDLRIKKKSNAVNRVETTEGGVIFTVGRGSAVTGRGAHCLSGDTVIETKAGPKTIGEIAPGEMVLSYDLSQGCLVWARTQAVARRPCARLYRVSTAAGRVVEATTDHRFYAGRKWRECGSLASGDALLCHVRQDVRARCGGRQEARTSRTYGVLLLRGLRMPWPQLEAIWREGLRPLWSACATRAKCWYPPIGPYLLFSPVLDGGATGRTAGARTFPIKAMQTMRLAVRAVERKYAILLDALQEQGAFAGYAWQNKPAMAGRGKRLARVPREPEKFSRDTSAGFVERQSSLLALQMRRWFGGSSYQRSEHRQSARQSGNAMPVVSHEGALYKAAGDIVVSVADTGREADTFDLQIEGTRCFFANGILVHNCILLDDPLKDRKEADSVVIRDGLWQWYSQVLRTRLMNKYGTIVIIATRWNEDDLSGRLIDPMNPYYTIEEARLWHKISLPALAEDDDILGRAPGQALWPERFDEEYLNEIKLSDPRGFMALYQGRPAPKEGAFFKAADLVPYQSMRELPPTEEMRFYAASDHAVALDQKADKTCLMVVGIDQRDHLWVMPEVIWARMDSNATVENMLNMMSKYSPQFWWAEQGQITKSIAPFLRKRMLEKRVFCAMDPIVPAHDKQQRAQAIQARSAMKMVHFPVWCRWWSEAQDQILKFPHGAKDDFVDTLSLIGLGLAKMRSRMHQKPPEQTVREGSFRALWAQTKRREQRERERRSLSGWL